MFRRRRNAADEEEATANAVEDGGLEIEFNGLNDGDGDESEGDDGERLRRGRRRRRRQGQRAVPERGVVVTAAALPRKVPLAA